MVRSYSVSTVVQEPLVLAGVCQSPLYSCWLCHCRHLGSQLAEMERAIERMMEADLVNFAMEDIALKGRAITNPSLAPDISSSEVHRMCVYTTTPTLIL